MPLLRPAQLGPSDTVQYQSPAGVLNNYGFEALLPEWIIILEQWIYGDVSVMDLQRSDTSGQGGPAAGQSLCFGPDLCPYPSFVPFPALFAGLVCGASLGIFVLVMKTSHGTA